MSLDISVIILTYNEEQHIERCIKNILPIAKNIFLVDSFSNDRTIEIAQSLGAKVFQNKWENNHAKQFNWGLENLPIDTEWVLRIDADEYLTQALILELQEKLEQLDLDISGVSFKRRHFFLGKWVKRGIYPVKILRLFRYQKAFCEQRWMDEHIQLIEGKSIEFKHDFVDHNLNTLHWWTEKHNGYAIREAIELLDVEYNILNNRIDLNHQLDEQASIKRKRKLQYVKQPLFFRSFAYFCYRYFFKLAFLEGKEAFLWNFLQGWWYRTLVDAKIYEIKKACGNDKAKIIAYIQDHYKLKIEEKETVS